MTPTPRRWRNRHVAGAIHDMMSALPPRAEGQQPATCLIVDCGAGDESARFAADLARVCAESGRSTLLMELTEQAGRLSLGWSRDLPVGVIDMNAGFLTPAILVMGEGAHRLVVAPCVYKEHGDAMKDETEDFGRAADFDLVIGYAPDAWSLRSPDDAAAGAGLVALAIPGEGRLTEDQRSWVERMQAAAGDRCKVVTAG